MNISAESVASVLLMDCKLQAQDILQEIVLILI